MTEWISVSERLPSTPHPVLAWVGGTARVARYWGRGYPSPWDNCGETCGIIREEVTHWAAFDPPKESK